MAKISASLRHASNNVIFKRSSNLPNKYTFMIQYFKMKLAHKINKSLMLFFYRTTQPISMILHLYGGLSITFHSGLV